MEAVTFRGIQPYFLRINQLIKDFRTIFYNLDQTATSHAMLSFLQCTQSQIIIQKQAIENWTIISVNKAEKFWKLRGIIIKTNHGGWENLFSVLGKVSYTVCMGKDLEHPTEMHALSQTIFVGALVKENPKANGLTELLCSME